MDTKMYWCERELSGSKTMLTGHLREVRFYLRNAYGSACQNFDGWGGTYGSTYGALTDTYGTAVGITMRKVDFRTLTGELTVHLRELTALQRKQQNN